MEVIKYESAFGMLQTFEKEGKIKLFLYPNKPKGVSVNDYDLIVNAFNIYIMNSNQNLNILEKLKKQHPEFGLCIKYIKEKLDDLDEKSQKEFVNKLYDRNKDKLCADVEEKLTINQNYK